MKQHGIKKIVVSPGMKNLPVIASVQFDPYFEVYSCVDERYAAYMVTGLSTEKWLLKVYCRDNEKKNYFIVRSISNYVIFR